MDSVAEITVFFQSIAVGFLSGAFYEPFSVLRWICGIKCGKKVVLGVLFDVLFFAAFALFATCAATALRFPAFRWYIGVGYAAGFLLYLKILHRILDFFEKVCYNAVYKVVVSRKIARKRRKIERKQGKKV